MKVFGSLARFASVAVLASTVGSSHANLITNGSFETGVNPPASNTYQSLGAFYGNQLNITGWEVFNDTLAWIGGPLQGLTAQHLVRFLDLTDTQLSNPFGGIRQTINLAANTAYNLTFWLGTSNSFNGLTTVQVLVGAGNTASFQSAPGTNMNNVWLPKALTFNSGLGGPTQIAFLGWAGQDYIGLDNVSVTVVPEPTSLAMLFAGLAAVGTVVARRRKQIS